MNCNTQNEKIKSISEKTLIVGIDIGSETHYARAFDWRGYEYSKKAFEFSNSEEGFISFMRWIEEIGDKEEKETIIPGMEPTGHYWFNLAYFLQNNGMKPVHVNPHHVKKSKELDDNNPSKNDRKDPKVIAGLVKEGRFMYPYIPTGIYAEIRNLSNLRLQTQEQITAIKNRMARWISIYFPEYKDVYGQIDAISGLMVLEKAPLPSDIVELGVDGVNKIWRDAKLRASGLKRAKRLVVAAEHSIGKKEAPITARIEMQTLLRDYCEYNNRMKQLMELMEIQLGQIQYIDKLLEIEEYVGTNPDIQLYYNTFTQFTDNLLNFKRFEDVHTLTSKVENIGQLSEDIVHDTIKAYVNLIVLWLSYWYTLDFILKCVICRKYRLELYSTN